MRRWVAILVVIAFAVVGVRLSLPWMGRRLIRSDSLKPADAIVVLGALRLERAIEAGKLYQEGWAPRVLLLRPPDVVRDRLRQQLGLNFPSYLDIQRDVLLQMHVPASAIAPSPNTQDSTRQEATATAAWARQLGFRRIIVVTSPYHTARAGHLFDGSMKGFCEVIVHPDRYEYANPDRWWAVFPDRSDVALEYLKRVYAVYQYSFGS